MPELASRLSAQEGAAAAHAEGLAGEDTPHADVINIVMPFIVMVIRPIPHGSMPFGISR